MKIGVLTHYYSSMNYGGVLQAYALVTALRKMGYDAEQICYKFWDVFELSEKCVGNYNINSAFLPSDLEKRPPEQPEEQSLKEHYALMENRVIEPRKVKFRNLRNNTPHSEKVYSRSTIFLANNEYDAFITGSDQVWNLKWYSPAFFLEFADETKKKIAYAASAGTAEFDEVQKKFLSKVLPKFNAISVRESDLVGVCSNAAGKSVVNTIDSVLLLDREDWDKIASERMINDRYMFCFFYNPTDPVYELAKKYAEMHSLKIVTIPYAFCDLKMHLDDDFGDIRMETASPEDFISLIKYADCIFTDSFHAVVYSLIYGKQAYSFKREWNNKAWKSDMSSRIYTLFEIFGCLDHFCDSEEKVSMEYIDTVKDIDYTVEHKNFEKIRNESKEFLINSLSFRIE